MEQRQFTEKHLLKISLNSAVNGLIGGLFTKN